MAVRAKIILNLLNLKSKQQSNSGFTLIELLITLIIAFLIFTGLMTLLIELLQTNQRETVRTETQREMQLALDFIASEMREAVHIYDGACLQGQNNCRGIFQPGSNIVPIQQNSVPIIAFWKLEPLPDAVCDGGGDSVCISGKGQTLIVYAIRQKDSTGNNQTWRGDARIVRYELSPFQQDGNRTPGYIDPTNPFNTYDTWPSNANGGQANIPDSSWSHAVLVDSVHDRWVEDKSERDTDNDGNPNCPGNNLYRLTPDPATLQAYQFTDQGNPIYNFYACVRLPSAQVQNLTSAEANFNQKVILFLRGNTSARTGAKTLQDEEFLPVIETQVVNRSVLYKEPPPF